MSDTNQDASADSTEKDMPLISHLLELRDRLLRMVLAVIVVFVALIYWANDLYLILSAPLIAHLPENSNMIATDIISPFLTPFKMTAVLAVFLAMPYILHQAWVILNRLRDTKITPACASITFPGTIWFGLWLCISKAFSN